MENKTFHLDTYCLGVAFTTQTPQDFYDNVCSFREIRSMDKLPRVPRVKKLIVFHTVNEQTKLCELCGKKPRTPRATCSGKKSDKKSIDKNSPLGE